MYGTSARTSIPLDAHGYLIGFFQQHFVFPLCDLVVRDKKSANYTIQ